MARFWFVAISVFALSVSVILSQDFKIPLLGDNTKGMSNILGDIVESKFVQLLTGVPLTIAQGVKGKGDWLAGVVDDLKIDETIKQKRKDFLEKYQKAVAEKNEDAMLQFQDLVKKYGYALEEYEVKTEDGYLLKLFRIPYGPNNPLQPGERRPVVFLEHGLGCSSDDFIIKGPGKAIGYLLVDAGFDVWMGNERGNKHSRKHVTKVPKEANFWDFSWDEIGRFDLPAMIDFTLNTTGMKDLYYIGYSQGTTTFFVMCSMRPEYNAKVKLSIALAPVGWMSNAVSPILRLLSPGNKAADWATKSLGIGEFLPSNQFMAVAGGILCQDKAITQDICAYSLFLAVGFNVDQYNSTMLPVILGHYPSGASVRQYLHYAQGVTSKEFRRYDHGYIKNNKIYGKMVPPSYNLSLVTSHVSLYYSEKDWFAHPKDVTKLAKSLPNVDSYLVPDPRFTHLDFMWAINADKVVYQRVIQQIQEDLKKNL